MKPQEVTDALKLNQLKDKIWYVVPSCATTGEGLLEGLVRLSLSPLPSRPSPTQSNKHDRNPDSNATTGLALQQRQIPAHPKQEIETPSDLIEREDNTSRTKSSRLSPRVPVMNEKIFTIRFSYLPYLTRNPVSCHVYHYNCKASVMFMSCCPSC